jgi:hypothetical protein
MAERSKSEPEVVGVSIDAIDATHRPASLMRVRPNEDAIAEYKGILDELPPVQLAYDASIDRHWLIDGRHTVKAAKAGPAHTNMLIRQSLPSGTRRTNRRRVAS